MGGIGSKGRTGVRGGALTQFAEAGKISGGLQPVESELMTQILEALQTGGVNARLPIAQQAVEQSRQATSSALQQTRESLARSGLQGTPFGENILGQTTLAGEQQARLIPTQIAQGLIDLAPQLMLGLRGIQSGLLASGTSGLAQQKAISMAEEQKTSQLIGSIVGGIKLGGKGGK